MFESHLKMWCFDALGQIIVDPHPLSSYHGNLGQILDEHQLLTSITAYARVTHNHQTSPTSLLSQIKYSVTKMIETAMLIQH